MVTEAIKSNPRLASPKGFMSREWLTPSVIALIVANLVPLYGVLFLGWKIFPIMVIFWSEDIIIAFYTVIKMLLAPSRRYCSPYSKEGNAGKGNNIFLFLIFSGIFLLSYGIVILVIFGPGALEKGDIHTFSFVIKKYNLAYAVIALFLSHGISFVRNYLIKGEKRRASTGELMVTPVTRVFLMNLVVGFGALFVFLFNSPVAGLVFLIFIKIILDVRAHLREHREVNSRRYPRLPP